MTLRNGPFYICFCLFIAFFSNCQNEANKQADKALESIPINSTVVTAFDVPSLMEKANFEAVQQMEFYQFFLQKAEEESDLLAMVMTNPENAGVDLTKKAYLSVELDQNNPEEIYTGIIFNLASSEDFNNFASSFRGITLGEGQGYQKADLNDGVQLAWNDRIGVIALGEGIIEMEEVVSAFFNPTDKNNLSTHKNLTGLLAQNHDITTWLTTNPLAQNNSAKLVLSLAKIEPEALNDNFVHGFMDFNQGQVEAQLNYQFQEALVEDFRMLFKDQIKTDFTPYITGKNLNSFFGLALDFNGINSTLSKRPQVKMFADFALKSYGLSVQKLKAALDGDLVIATYTGNVNNRQEGLIALKLNNPAKFEAFLAYAEEQEWVTKTAKGRFTFASQVHHFLKENLPIDLGSSYDNQMLLLDGIAFFSGNIDRLDAIEFGKIEPQNQLPNLVEDLTQENPLALFLDFNSLKRVGVPGAVDLHQLQFNSNGKGANLTLQMKEENINSLNAIFKAINNEFQKGKEQGRPVSQEKS